MRQIEDRQVFAVDEGAVLDLGQQVVAQVDRRLEGKKSEQMKIFSSVTTIMDLMIQWHSV